MALRLQAALAALTLAAAACAAPVAAWSAPDPMKALAEADANRDGSISRGEFIDNRRARFSQLDRNHDGEISADDLPRRLRARAGNRLDDAIRAADSDGDGGVSREEFVNGGRLFELGDRDGDGVIDPAEMDRLRSVLAARRGG